MGTPQKRKQVKFTSISAAHIPDRDGRIILYATDNHGKVWEQWTTGIASGRWLPFDVPNPVEPE